MVWSGIGLSLKFGPVNFQNIDTIRGNGVMGVRYIEQVLRPMEDIQDTGFRASCLLNL